MEDLQQNEVLKNNAELIFKPKFTPFYPELLDKWLTMNETLVYWFIDFYLSDCWDKFYFTNKQIWSLYHYSERYVSKIISNLINKKLIICNYKIKSDWWKIRFIQKFYSDTNNSSSLTRTTVPINNNKIKDNKINYTINNKSNDLLFIDSNTKNFEKNFKKETKEEHSQKSESNKNYIAAIWQKSKSFFDIFKNEITESFIGMLKVKYSLSDEQIKDIANNFILYRTEKNPNGKKERWEMQKTFDIKRRFYTWLNNDKRYNKRPQDTTWVVIIW